MCELFDVLFPFNGAKLAINSLSCSISVRKLTKFGKIVSAYLLMLMKKYIITMIFSQLLFP